LASSTQVTGGDQQPAATKERWHTPLHRPRLAFRRWRRSRPFWGGLWSVLGGLVILAGPATAFKVILVAGQIVWVGILVGLLISAFGLLVWFAPSQRQIAGILIVFLAAASFISSDLGGFFIGMILAITGGAMVFAWVPEKVRKNRKQPVPTIATAGPGSVPQTLSQPAPPSPQQT
jgi:hypothetical protein